MGTLSLEQVHSQPNVYSVEQVHFIGLYYPKHFCSPDLINSKCIWSKTRVCVEDPLVPPGRAIVIETV